MFTPWVGSDFGKSDRYLATRRLLVVGESHHSQEHKLGSMVPGMTVDVVTYYQTGKWVPWMRTLDNIAAAVSGRPKRELGRTGVNSIWDQIAFYNYVPVVAAPASRSRPSAEFFAMGVQPFQTVLERLQPGAIVVCGYELWARLIPHHAEGHSDNVWRPSTPFASLGARQIPALRMVHPSTAFSPSKWAPHIADLLERAVPPADNN